MRWSLIVGGLPVSVVGLVAVALAAGDFSSAKDKAEKFKSEYQSLRALTPKETRDLVTAICEAEEEKRADVASSAHDRVANLIDDKYEDLEDLKDLKEEATRKLDEVLSDENLKDKHSEAKSYKEALQKQWETIGRMTKAIRGKNHPVVRFMIDEGNRQHRDRQTSSSYCDVYEYKVGSGRADCLRASDCTVVELKPDNRRAIEKGKDQANGYASTLNNSADERQKLRDQDSDFAKCEKFDSEVWCYKLCPEIDPETNEMKSTSASWRECG